MSSRLTWHDFSYVTMAPLPQRASHTNHSSSTPLKNALRPQRHAYPLGTPRRRPKLRQREPRQGTSTLELCNVNSTTQRYLVFFRSPQRC